MTTGWLRSRVKYRIFCALLSSKTEKSFLSRSETKRPFESVTVIGTMTSFTETRIDASSGLVGAAGTATVPSLTFGDGVLPCAEEFGPFAGVCVEEAGLTGAGFCADPRSWRHRATQNPAAIRVGFRDCMKGIAYRDYTDFCSYTWSTEPKVPMLNFGLLPNRRCLHIGSQDSFDSCGGIDRGEALDGLNRECARWNRCCFSKSRAA
jgi:hypothetical protein